LPFFAAPPILRNVLVPNDPLRKVICPPPPLSGSLREPLQLPDQVQRHCVIVSVLKPIPSLPPRMTQDARKGLARLLSSFPLPPITSSGRCFSPWNEQEPPPAIRSYLLVLLAFRERRYCTDSTLLPVLSRFFVVRPEEPPIFPQVRNRMLAPFTLDPSYFARREKNELPAKIRRSPLSLLLGL